MQCCFFLDSTLFFAFAFVPLWFSVTLDRFLSLSVSTVESSDDAMVVLNVLSNKHTVTNKRIWNWRVGAWFHSLTFGLTALMTNHHAASRHSSSGHGSERMIRSWSVFSLTGETSWYQGWLSDLLLWVCTVLVNGAQHPTGCRTDLVRV